MKHSVKIYSRIGELMQGVLPDRSTFMISGLPSRHFFSMATIGDGTTPALPPKASRALSLFMKKRTPAEILPITLYSNIPPGKGLSSSSTDILSTLFVANDYLQAGFSPEDLYQMAAMIEPTDPCLSEDIVLFKQHAGLVERCISLPPMDILYFDAAPHRQIDTGVVQRQWTPGAGKFFDWLLRKFLAAAEASDYDALFDSITYSAEYNQTVIALPRFDEYLQLARETKSGLMVAHSGTIIGLLTRPASPHSLHARLQRMTDQPIYSEHYPFS